MLKLEMIIVTLLLFIHIVACELSGDGGSTGRLDDFMQPIILSMR